MIVNLFNDVCYIFNASIFAFVTKDLNSRKYFRKFVVGLLECGSLRINISVCTSACGGKTGYVWISLDPTKAGLMLGVVFVSMRQHNSEQ